MINWATPALGLVVAACLIPPLILLYFLKLRRREQPIPSTLLWKQSIQDLQANALFQRLRPNWLLFLQLIVLILILLAIAQPERTGPIKRGSRTVLLIDHSASMSATDLDNGRTRLEDAKEQAREYVRGMRTGGSFAGPGSGEQVMVIAFADDAQIQCGFTSSKAQITDAIEKIQPTDGGSKIREAIELARAYSLNTDIEGPGRDQGPVPSMLIFSDGRIEDLEELASGRERFTYVPIGDVDNGGRNLGLSALGARRSLTDPNDLEIYLRVANYTTQTAMVDVDLSVGSLLVDTQRVEVPPAIHRDPRANVEAAPEEPEQEAAQPSKTGLQPGEKAVSFTLTDPDGLTIAVTVNSNDDFPTDDRAFAVIPPAQQMRVAFVGPTDGWVVETAISGVPFVQGIERLSPGRFAELAQQGETQKYDVIVIDGEQVQTLGPGRYLLLGVLPPIDGFARADETQRSAVLAWDERHPVNKNMNYYPLELAPFEQVTLPDNARILVEGTGGPLISEYTRRDMSLLFVAFRPVASSWPFDVNLVKFVQNALDYLGHLGDAIADESLSPGEVIEARLDAGATNIKITRPDGREVALSPTDPTLTTYVADRAGLYSMTYQTREGQQRSRQFAVNLLDTNEAELSVAPGISLGQENIDALGEGEGVEKQSLWPWALAAAILFLCVEWWLYNRRAAI